MSAEPASSAHSTRELPHASPMNGEAVGWCVEERPAAPARTAPPPADPDWDAMFAPKAPASALSGIEFFRELQREKRRADRSKTPLAIALYRVADGEVAARRLAQLLLRSKRETDILARVGSDRLVVLFPDTGAEGLQRFVLKIAERAGEPRYDARTACYPGLAFDELVRGIEPYDGESTLLQDEAVFDGAGYGLKRSLDIAGALVALLLAAPLMLIVAMLIAIESRGPVIFRQERVGRGGVPFRFYKFRSMVTHVDDSIHREFVARLIKGEAAAAVAGGGGGEVPVYKMKADPRVTRVGRFIRRTSIDEIPQFINVLKGDMSLVGPRPPLPYEAERYEAWHRRRVQSVRPGITGLWQIEGRSKVPFDEMVRMDLRYIRRCSLGLDLKILVKTVQVVLHGDGAS